MKEKQQTKYAAKLFLAPSLSAISTKKFGENQSISNSATMECAQCLQCFACMFLSI